ncbi:hypothetical protein [Micromonospora saelicesensis]|uniref:hypothetical protein n=1 Tax=Micromonospora saelicesensis TaxID=285676 RepID=UPI0011BEA584|nr:hypothetical protein [Micromonospora saelicesensis]
MRTRTLRGAVVVALSTGAVASTLVLSAAPAAAYPSNCGSAMRSDGVVSAWCSTGTGSVSAVAGCEWFGWWTTAQGPWVGVATGASHVSCPWPYSPRWTGFYARD